MFAPTTSAALRSLGWRSSQPQPQHAGGRLVKLGGGSVAEIDCTAATLRTLGDAENSADTADATGAARVIFILRGRGSVRVPDGNPAVMSAGDLIVLPDHVEVTIGVIEHVRFIELRTRLDRVDDEGRLPLRLGHVYSVSRSAATPFVGLVKACLDDSSERSPRSSRHLRRAINSTLAALMTEAVGEPEHTLTPREARLVADASEIADRHSKELGFTVQDLAAQLGVSRVYLHRVLVKHGTTPSVMLAAARERWVRVA